MNSPIRTLEDKTIPQQITHLATLRPIHAAFTWFQLRENELQRIQLEVARIPAPPFGEGPRAEWLRAKFKALGLSEIEVDEIGNVVAVIPGQDRTAPAVAISAHLDTVFPRDTEITISQDRDRIYGPGVSDNAAGLTAMLAIAMCVREARIQSEADIIFIGNVGEE